MDAIKTKDDESDEAPIIKRKDAYDATLDVPDPEDIEKNLTATDVEKEPTPNDDDEDITTSEYDVRLLKSSSTGKYALATKMGGKIVSMTDVPTEYVQQAKENPLKVLNKLKSIESDKEPEMSDEDLMEALDEMLSESDVEKGKFTTWCKKNGFEGPSISCAKKAMGSDSTSAHKMATFYMNTVKPKGKTAKDI